MYGLLGMRARVAAAPVDAVAATNTLTNNETDVSDGDTVTVGDAVYTFVDALTPEDGEVLIAGAADDSLTNLAHAINGTGGTPGTDYQVAGAHPSVSAGAVSSHAITLTARTKGAAGNAIALETDAATLTPGSATFEGGIDGTPGVLGDVIIDSGQPYICLANSSVASSGTWKKLSVAAL